MISVNLHTNFDTIRMLIIQTDPDKHPENYPETKSKFEKLAGQHGQKRSLPVDQIFSDV